MKRGEQMAKKPKNQKTKPLNYTVFTSWCGSHVIGLRWSGFSRVPSVLLS
jgi:hypothetical protein